MKSKTLSYAEEQLESALSEERNEDDKRFMEALSNAEINSTEKCLFKSHQLSDFGKGAMDEVIVLGTPYMIIVKGIEEDDALKKCWGYCDCTSKEIIVTCLDDAMKVDSIGTRPKEILKKTVRHEIVHAFLWESGLYSNTNNFEQWACNEEMIDWIAMQGVKIMRAWAEVDVI